MDDRFAGLGAGAGGELKLYPNQLLVAKTKEVEDDIRGEEEDAAGGKNVSVTSVFVSGSGHHTCLHDTPFAASILSYV